MHGDLCSIYQVLISIILYCTSHIEIFIIFILTGGDGPSRNNVTIRLVFGMFLIKDVNYLLEGYDINFGKYLKKYC